MKGIVLQAQLADSSGFGVAARQYYKILKSIAEDKRIPFRIVITKADSVTVREHRIWEEHEIIPEDKIENFIEKNDYIYFFHANLNFAMKLKTVRILAKNAEKNYCLTVWESNSIHDSWKEFLQEINCKEIIVPSIWNREVFQKAIPEAKVSYIPHYYEHKNEDIKKETNLTFSLLSISQDVPRKNWYKTILAFYSCFYDKNVTYTIKTNGELQASEGYREEQRRKFIDMINSIKSLYPSSICKIKLIYGVEEDSKIEELYRNNTHFYTATHGEGFGLGILEAKMHGMCIIAPDHGGHMEFCDKESDYLFQTHKEYIFDISGVFPKNATWYDHSVYEISEKLKKAYLSFSASKIHSIFKQQDKFNFYSCKYSFNELIEVSLKDMEKT